MENKNYSDEYFLFENIFHFTLMRIERHEYARIIYLSIIRIIYLFLV